MRVVVKILVFEWLIYMQALALAETYDLRERRERLGRDIRQQLLYLPLPLASAVRQPLDAFSPRTQGICTLKRREARYRCRCKMRESSVRVLQQGSIAGFLLVLVPVHMEQESSSLRYCNMPSLSASPLPIRRVSGLR